MNDKEHKKVAAAKMLEQREKSRAQLRCIRAALKRAEAERELAESERDTLVNMLADTFGWKNANYSIATRNFENALLHLRARWRADLNTSEPEGTR